MAQNKIISRLVARHFEFYCRDSDWYRIYTGYKPLIRQTATEGYRTYCCIDANKQYRRLCHENGRRHPKYKEELCANQ